MLAVWVLGSAAFLATGATQPLRWWLIVYPCTVMGLGCVPTGNINIGLLLIATSLVMMARAAARRSGLGAILFAWLGLCALAVLGLSLVTALLVTVGAPQVPATAVALVLVDAGLVYTGWWLVRRSRRPF